jgi:hypothetical protein
MDYVLAHFSWGGKLVLWLVREARDTWMLREDRVKDGFLTMSRRSTRGLLHYTVARTF